MAQRNEIKRLDMLNKLKSTGGPFTDSAEVEAFLKDDNIADNVKNKE